MESHGKLEPELERALIDVVGRRHVLSDPDLRAGYEVDWMGRRTGHARAVVRPGSVDEMAALVRICAGGGVPVLPQGGNTGLVGGGVPRGGEVILSTRRLDWVGDVDDATGLLAAGAGVTLARAREAALGAGLDVGVDLASRSSATLGGMVSTNAGGLRVLRYGHMRAQVAGIEAVLPSGRIIRRMGGLSKDAVGWDLTGLFCGSEGTLGVVTSVLVRLVPADRSGLTVLVGAASLADALSVAQRVRRRCSSLQSAEVMFADGLARVRERFAVASPLGDAHHCQLLLDFCSPTPPTDALVEEAAAALGESPEIDASAVAVDVEGRGRIWALRERHPEIVVGQGRPYKLDVSMSLGRLVPFERQVRAALAERVPDAEVVLYGHLADGSLHVNVAVPGDGGADGLVEETVFGLVRQHHGSISAEHGVGTDKIPWVHYTRGSPELELMRLVKSVVDPAGVMNPGVLLPPPQPNREACFRRPFTRPPGAP